MSEVSKYELEAVYKDVEYAALTNTQAQTTPKAILLGGQPGSGKSVLAGDAAQELRDKGGAIVIDSDQLRENNPLYKQLSREDPQNAADRTQKQAGEWANRLTVAAAENRRNLVIDGTMRNPEAVRNLALRLKGAGYEVEARVMAVSREASLARARLRFEKQVAERGVGRFANQAQHDNAYAAMVESVRVLESEKLVDMLRVYDSNHQPIYENKLKTGERAKAPEAARAIEQERGREWTHAERSSHVSTLNDIHTLAKQREESGRAMPADSRELAAKLDNAKIDLARFEQTATSIGMKQRLLVMNGRKLVQSERGGQWATDKVEKAGTLKPGIYNIHLSTKADKSQSHDGVIVHADKDHVYQQVGKQFVRHDLENFDKVHGIGSNSSIKYDGKKAQVAPSSVKLGRGLSR